VDDSYPFALSRELARREPSVRTDVEVVAHPWITLVDLVDTHKEVGMATRFWDVRSPCGSRVTLCSYPPVIQASPRDTATEWSYDGVDTPTIAFLALGTSLASCAAC
jgi:hypothetical protein